MVSASDTTICCPRFVSGTGHTLMISITPVTMHTAACSTLSCASIEQIHSHTAHDCTLPSRVKAVRLDCTLCCGLYLLLEVEAQECSASRLLEIRYKAFESGEIISQRSAYNHKCSSWRPPVWLVATEALPSGVFKWVNTQRSVVRHA